MNKTIVVQWERDEERGYTKSMRVAQSNHPDFIPGSYFDFGFFSIATDEGYTIISIPMN